MPTLTPTPLLRFEGVVSLSDIPAELHAGLKRYAKEPFCESDGTGGRYAVIDFEGAGTDRAPDSVVYALLNGTLPPGSYPVPEDVIDWGTFDPQGYAAHLLAARYLKANLSPAVVLRDRVAVHVL